MGGVPFKSTGCNTCRRRKVKCDEAKPECMRCVKNGHVCTGYERTRVFIHKSASVMVDDNRTLTRQSRPNGATSARACILNLVDRDIPRLNINAEVRSQLLNSLIDWYLPTSHLLQGGAGKERKNLLQSLPEVSGSSILLDKAITSLSTVFLAKQNRDGRLLEYSTKLYGNAMETLHGKIRAGSKLGPDVLYTTVVFQLYELINCSPPGFSAWIAHVQGSSAVTSQCAGQNDRNSAEKLFHRQLRYVALCDAIGKRTAPGYFNSPGWRNGGLATSEPIDELMDELTECTALMEQVDAYVEHADPNSLQSIQVGEHLMLSCLSLEEKLHQTCLAMEEKLGCPSVLSPDSSLYKDFGSALLTDLFPEPLQYPSLTCAESHLVYWTTLLLLYPLLDQLMVVLDRPDNDVALPKCQSPKDGIGSPSSGSEVLADFTALAELYADQVCRSVIYCLQPGMKTLGAQNLLAPLSQSTQFFAVEGLPEKRAWCQGVFMSLPRVGLGIAPFVKDLVWPKYQLAQRQKSSSPEKSPSPRTQSSSLGSPSSGVEEHKQLPTRSATSSSEYFEKDGLQ